MLHGSGVSPEGKSPPQHCQGGIPLYIQIIMSRLLPPPPPPPFVKKVAFAILNKLLDEFSEKFGGKISQEKTDNCMPFPALDEALTKYQDPAEADKITKIQKDLEETKQARSLSKKPLSPPLEKYSCNNTFPSLFPLPLF